MSGEDWKIVKVIVKFWIDYCDMEKFRLHPYLGHFVICKGFFQSFFNWRQGADQLRLKYLSKFESTFERVVNPRQYRFL
jgi:hypothetical protein